MVQLPANSGGVHYIKSVRIRNFSDPHFPTFRLTKEIYSVNIRIQSQCGKIRTRKTPDTDTFYAVVLRTLRKIYENFLVKITPVSH